MTEAYMSQNVDNVSMITGGSRAQGRGAPATGPAGPSGKSTSMRRASSSKTDDQRAHKRHEHALAPSARRPAEPPDFHHRSTTPTVAARVVHFYFRRRPRRPARWADRRDARGSCTHQQLGDVDGVDAFGTSRGRSRPRPARTARALGAAHRAEAARRPLHALFQQKGRPGAKGATSPPVKVLVLDSPATFAHAHLVEKPTLTGCSPMEAARANVRMALMTRPGD